MKFDIEELLAALPSKEGGDPRAPQAVFQRLKFLAQAMQGAEGQEGVGLLLRWLDQKGWKSRALPADGCPVTIGRDPACEVVLAGERVSRRHCLVRAVLSGGEIVDLDSANGTLVNGAPLKAGTLVLRDGDVIEVGGVPLAVVLGRGTDKASTDS